MTLWSFKEAFILNTSTWENRAKYLKYAIMCNKTTVLFSCNTRYSSLNLGSSRRKDCKMTLKRSGGLLSANCFIRPGSYTVAQHHCFHNDFARISEIFPSAGQMNFLKLIEKVNIYFTYLNKYRNDFIYFI